MFTTEIPHVKSMYVFPSTSSITEPWARFATIGDVFVLVARNLVSRSMISRAFGPGGVTLMSGTFTTTPRTVPCPARVLIDFEKSDGGSHVRAPLCAPRRNFIHGVAYNLVRAHTGPADRWAGGRLAPAGARRAGLRPRRSGTARARTSGACPSSRASRSST